MKEKKPGHSVYEYDGGMEYARLIEIFPAIDLDRPRYKNDPVRKISDHFKKELASFFNNLAKFKSRKKIDSELAIFRRRVQLILEQAENMDFVPDYQKFKTSKRSAVKTFAELFGFVPSLGENIESYNDVVIDPSKLTNSVLFRLGLIESEAINRRIIDFNDVISRLIAIFESAEVLDEQFARQFRLADGRVLTVFNENSQEFSKKFVVSDIASTILSRKNIESRYKSDELVTLRDLEATVDEFLAEIIGIGDGDLSEDLMLRLESFDVQFENYINTLKKEVKAKLPKLGTLDDSLERRNPTSKPLIARAIKGRLADRRSQIRYIRPYIASDFFVLDEINRRESRVVSGLYEMIVETQSRFSLLKETPLSKVDKLQKIRVLSGWKRDLEAVKFSPYKEVATLIVLRIDSIIESLNSYDVSNRNLSPNFIFGKNVLDVYLLCKIDDALKYVFNCKELLIDNGLNPYKARLILNMTVEMFRRMNLDSVSKNRKSGLNNVNEQMSVIWSLLRSVKSTIEDYFREYKEAKKSDGDLEQLNRMYSEKLSAKLKDINFERKVGGKKVPSIDPYKSMLEYVRSLVKDQNPTEVPQ